MKYLLTALTLMFTVTCFAADFTVEKGADNYEVTFYKEEIAKDGTTVLIEDYTRTYTVEEIDQKVINLKAQLAEKTKEINAKIDRLEKIKAEMIK